MGTEERSRKEEERREVKKEGKGERKEAVRR